LKAWKAMRRSSLGQPFKAAQMVGKALPSYHLAQLGWDSAGGFALHASDAMVLAAWAAVLAAIAMLRWRQEATATG